MTDLPLPIVDAAPGHGGFPASPPRASDEYPVVAGVPTCEKCKLQHVTLHGTESCAGHRAHWGTPCRIAVKVPGDRCKRHGGTRPGITERRREWLADETAATTLAEVGIPPLGNPVDHLAEVAAEAMALKGHFADTVAQLGDQYRFVDDKGAEQLDARVQLYERALDRCEKFLGNLVKIGFEERKLRLDESRVALMRTFIAGVIDDLGLNLDDPNVKHVITHWLPVLDGETVEPLPREAEMGDADDDADE